MEFEEQPNEQQCGNTCARVAKLPWLPSRQLGYQMPIGTFLSVYVAVLETGPTCKGSRLRGNVVGGNGKDSPRLNQGCDG